MAIYADNYDGKPTPVVDGFVIREPEVRQAGKVQLLSFGVSSNSKAGRYYPKLDAWGEEITEESLTKSGNYYTDLILNIELKFDDFDKFNGKVHKGDRVRVFGPIEEQAFKKRDGSQGRSLRVKYVAGFEVVSSRGSGAKVTSTPPATGTTSDPWIATTAPAAGSAGW